MKVKELIKELLELDMNKEIKYAMYDDRFCEIEIHEAMNYDENFNYYRITGE